MLFLLSSDLGRGCGLPLLHATTIALDAQGSAFWLGENSSGLDCPTQFPTHSGRLEEGWAASGHQHLTRYIINDL